MNSLHSTSWYGLTPLFARLPYRFVILSAGVGTFLIVLVATQLTTATPWLLAGCFVTPLFWSIYRGEPVDSLNIDPLAVACTAFVAWAGLTLLWSPGGGDAFTSWGRLCVYLAVTLVTRAAMGSIDPGAQRSIGWAFIAALGLAIVIAVIDTGWNLAVRRVLMSIFGGARADLGAVVENGWVIQLQSYETNKSMSVLFSLVWPGLLIAAGLMRGGWRRPIVIVAVALFAIAAALGENDTVKVALVVSAAAFLLIRQWPTSTEWLLGAGWITCTLAMLPIVLALTAVRAHDVAAIQDSGRHRLVIWGFVSQEVLKHPVFGSGLASTRQPRGGEGSFVDLGPTGKGWVAGTTVQPHNNFLQVWNELGGVGALLLCVAGLALVREITATAALLRPYYAAAFAGAAILASLQWTINSSWYIATFALTALFMRFGAELMKTSDGADAGSV